MVQVVVPLLVPIVTGLVGAFGLMIKDRRLARDSRNIRVQALAEARAEVEFASDWWKAQQFLGGGAASDSAQKLTAWLAEAEATVTDAQHVPIRHNKVTLRRLFLAEPVHRRTSKVLRVLFWISVLWLFVEAIAIATDISQKQQHSWVGSDIVGLIISAVIVLLLHVWAEASDQGAPTNTSETLREPDARAIDASAATTAPADAR